MCLLKRKTCNARARFRASPQSESFPKNQKIQKLKLARPKMNRKLKIKPFSSQNSSCSNWQVIENAILQIYSKNGSLLSFEELYRNSYNLVVSKNGELLYQNTRKLLQKQLVSYKDNLGSLLASDLGLLVGINNIWTEHSTCMLMIRDILMYLVRICKFRAGVYFCKRTVFI